jgi:hypothetical protein
MKQTNGFARTACNLVTCKSLHYVPYQKTLVFPNYNSYNVLQ